MDQKLALLESEKTILIDWINSLPFKSCITVQSVADLKTGVALGDIAQFILDRPIQQINPSPTDKTKCIYNFRILLFELSSVLPDSLKFRPEEFYKNDLLICSLVRWVISTLDQPFYQKLKESFWQLYSPKHSPQKGVSSSERTRYSSQKSPMFSQSKLNTRIPSAEVLEQNQPVSHEKELSSIEGILNIGGNSLLDFFIDLHVLRARADFRDVEKACVTGVLYADLINALEGRGNTIKGIDRNPKTNSARTSNVLRALRYLRNMPKMNGRFLWSEKELLEGDLEVIKGLIFDILSLYKRFPRAKSGNINTGPTKRNLSPKEEVVKEDHYEPPPVNDSIADYPYTFLSAAASIEDYKASTESIDRVVTWVETLGLGTLLISNRQLTDDVVRNGILLCELANLITPNRKISFKTQPRTVQEAKQNFEQAFSVLRRKCPSIPMRFYSCIEKIIKGDSSIVWSIISYIMQEYPNLKSYTPEVRSKDLPYSTSEIEKLKSSIFEWIQSLSVIEKNLQVNSLQELILDLRSGVLISDIVSRVLSTSISGIFRNPKTPNCALSNIKKSLDLLSKNPRMSQKYVWESERILEGNFGVILGLLEDLYRFYDGLAPRKRGPNYHEDGPYYGRRLVRCLSGLDPSVFRYEPPSVELPEETPKAPSLPVSPRRLLTIKKPALELYRELDPLKNMEESMHSVHMNLVGFEWLLALEIQIPETLDFEEEMIFEFSSGELLCNIIGKLERSKIEGLHPFYHTSAAGRHNISKAFEILRSKPTFPSRLYYVEDAVFDGQGDVIKAVLKEIYKIYKRTINNFIHFTRKKQALSVD